MAQNDEKIWALVAHLGTLIPIPLAGLIAPIVVWQTHKDKSEFVVKNAIESLNFQLTMLIAYAFAFILLFVLVGFVLMGVLWAISLIFCLIASIKAYQYEPYKYPFSINFISVEFH